MNPTQSNPAAQPDLSRTRSAFDRFHQDGHHSEDAMDLAIADALAGRMEHASALIAYRDQRDALRASVERLLPFAETKAAANEISGWASDAHAAVIAARAALAAAKGDAS